MFVIGLSFYNILNIIVDVVEEILEEHNIFVSQ
ncbi:hypothetical protein BDCR2A_01491 [Borrelia duttonii CR2A]|uniref:Uncharacterized protein n=1 Tax=Borrelia duttonii CR2A TaxID=1432657 RepID=W6TGN8_9SPIR|nr:hypothetical protein BDCR2A_01491 [Borrelia duttonii CR2A]